MHVTRSEQLRPPPQEAPPSTDGEPVCPALCGPVFSGQLRDDTLDAKAERDFDKLLRGDPRSALNKALLSPNQAPKTWRMLDKLTCQPPEISEYALLALITRITMSGSKSPQCVDPVAIDGLINCMDIMVQRYPNLIHYKVERATKAADAFLLESFATVSLNWDKRTFLPIKHPIREPLLHRVMIYLSEAARLGFFDATMSSIARLLVANAESLPKSCLRYMCEVFSETYMLAIQNGLGLISGSDLHHRRTLEAIKSISPDLYRHSD